MANRPLSFYSKQAIGIYSRNECKFETKIRGSITTRWSEPGIQRQMKEKIEMRVPGKGSEVAIPGRSLVPAAQAQAARSR